MRISDLILEHNRLMEAENLTDHQKRIINDMFYSIHGTYHLAVELTENKTFEELGEEIIKKLTE